jgi:hypothetical protein
VFLLVKAHSYVATGYLTHAIPLYYHSNRLKPQPMTYLCLAACYLVNSSTSKKWTLEQRNTAVVRAFGALESYQQLRLAQGDDAREGDGNDAAMRDDDAAGDERARGASGLRATNAHVLRTPVSLRMRRVEATYNLGRAFHHVRTPAFAAAVGVYATVSSDVCVYPCECAYGVNVMPRSWAYTTWPSRSTRTSCGAA